MVINLFSETLQPKNNQSKFNLVWLFMTNESQMHTIGGFGIWNEGATSVAAETKQLYDQLNQFVIMAYYHIECYDRDTDNYPSWYDSFISFIQNKNITLVIPILIQYNTKVISYDETGRQGHVREFNKVAIALLTEISIVLNSKLPSHSEEEFDEHGRYMLKLHTKRSYVKLLQKHTSEHQRKSQSTMTLKDISTLASSEFFTDFMYEKKYVFKNIDVQKVFEPWQKLMCVAIHNGYNTGDFIFSLKDYQNTLNYSPERIRWFFETWYDLFPSGLEKVVALDLVRFMEHSKNTQVENNTNIV